MIKHYYDIINDKNGTYISDTMVMDEDGNLIMQIGNFSSIDLEDGEISLTLPIDKINNND